MTPDATVAVLLARGLGTRMREGAGVAALDDGQRRAAAAGLKCLVPDARGRPFLHHILASLGAAGVTRVVLVVAPEHDALRDAVAAAPGGGPAVAFAVQPEPRGTADAVLAAREAVGGVPFLVLNADNLYPVEALRALVTLGEPGVAAFDREALLEGGAIEPSRIAAFALLTVDRTGYLERIVEKPDPDEAARIGDAAPVSMNLWRFGGAIFDACEAVPTSPRGERELPGAVALAVAAGMRFRVVRVRGEVLDLSRPTDIAGVAAALGERSLPR